MYSHYPLLLSFLRQNSLDLRMESDAQTLLALHCLKGTNNTAKSNHVSSSFLISYVFQLALISLNLWSFSAPLDPNPITDLDKFVNRLRVQYRTLRVVIFINEPFLIAFFSAFFFLVWKFIFFVDGFVIQTTSVEYNYYSPLQESSILF